MRGAMEEGGGALISLEDALQEVGTGPFSWLALVICGWANAADAVEIMGLSLAMPALEEGPARLLGGAGAAGALSSSIFLGMLAGGLVWGLVGDRWGRKYTLAAALLVNATFGLASAAARSTAALTALRVLAGVGVGGSVPVVFAYLIELTPAAARGHYQVGLASHWMVGSLLCAGLGWAIIPALGWRPFLAVSSAPAWLAAATLLALLPESPRHLAVRGRIAEAEVALRRMAAWNGPRGALPSGPFLAPLAGPAPAAAGGRAFEKAPPKADAEAPGAVVVVTAEEALVGASQQSAAGGEEPSAESAPAVARGPRAAAVEAARHARAALAAAAALLRPPLRGTTVPLLIAYAGLSGGWYSTVLWLPLYFQRRGAAASLNVYAEMMVVAAANLPGNLASWYLVDRIGRRWTTCGGLAASGAAALAFAFAPPTSGWSLAAAAAFNGISVAGWNALALLAAELYPTALRSSSNGLMTAAGRLSSFAFTLAAARLMELATWAPLVAAAALLLVGSAAVLRLPEPSGRPLADGLAGGAHGGAGGAGVGEMEAAAGPEPRTGCSVSAVWLRGRRVASVTEADEGSAARLGQ
ncbi:MAG: major facilitator superfamily domain-containing protein [Monoraphidium minutum]|nr:MAG: major facilitator superfamily domain-containing protein [Monoraphidium minutum]